MARQCKCCRAILSLLGTASTPASLPATPPSPTPACDMSRTPPAAPPPQHTQLTHCLMLLSAPALISRPPPSPSPHTRCLLAVLSAYACLHVLSAYLLTHAHTHAPTHPLSSLTPLPHTHTYPPRPPPLTHCLMLLSAPALISRGSPAKKLSASRGASCASLNTWCRQRPSRFHRATTPAEPPTANRGRPGPGVRVRVRV